MAQAATLKEVTKPKTAKQQEAEIAYLIEQLNQSGERISTSLENINRQMEAIVAEMRAARGGEPAL